MKPRILVIEDDPASMRLAALLLEHAGYEVLRAATAAEGLAVARAALPALILMDIRLPDMDGIEATRRLKSDPATRAIKVAAVTACAMEGDRERVRAAGCDGYVAKPINRKVLLAVVAKLLDEGKELKP